MTFPPKYLHIVPNPTKIESSLSYLNFSQFVSFPLLGCRGSLCHGFNQWSIVFLIAFSLFSRIASSAMPTHIVDDCIPISTLLCSSISNILKFGSPLMLSFCLNAARIFFFIISNCIFLVITFSLPCSVSLRICQHSRQ